MDPTPWLERWKENRIGFHEGRPNTLLARHIARLTGKRRMLVPLCGKSEDMVLLAAEGHEVWGVELAEIAVQAFFEEHALSPQVERLGALTRYTAQPFTLLAGDFFACNRELVGSFDAFYDRAALVALPPDLRGRYVQHLRSLMEPAATGLVITFEYPQEQMPGPPFSVDHAELRSHYEHAQVELLESRGAAFAQPGVHVEECCYLVTL